MDEFDRAIMEALNESVPPAGLSPGLADRLVARTRRRSRFWRMFLVLAVSSVVAAAVVTTTVLTGVPPVETASTGTTGVSPVETASTGTTGVSPVETPSGESLPLNITPNKEAGENSMTGKKAATAALAAAMAAAPLTAARGTDYQYIVSGYPAANESYPAASAGTSLVTATRSGVSAESSLEARYRTWDESNGIALRSDMYRAMMIIFR